MTNHPNRATLQIVRRAADNTISVYGPQPKVAFAGKKVRPHLGLIYGSPIGQAWLAAPSTPYNKKPDAQFETEVAAIDYLKSLLQLNIKR